MGTTSDVFPMALEKWLEKSSGKGVKGKCRLLWKEENPFYDTTVKVADHREEEGQCFQVHKLILAIGSEKLATELYGGCKNSEVPLGIPFSLEINFVRASIMKLVLEFLYTDSISESLEWPVVGGLWHASVELGIPGLMEFCENMMDSQLTCEEVLVLLQQILGLRNNEEFKWPAHYYKGLLSLCYSYILRNGEVISRSRNFIKLSFEQLTPIISSDFFIVYDELSVLKALKRWAKYQCRRKGMEKDIVQNQRKVLGTTSEYDVGLLGHVRFPLLNSDMNLEYDPLVPDSVFKFQLLEETSDIYSSKKRHSEITPENSKEFKDHVEVLSTNAMFQVSGKTEDRKADGEVSYAPTGDKSVSKNTNQADIKQPKESVQATSCIKLEPLEPLSPQEDDILCPHDVDNLVTNTIHTDNLVRPNCFTNKNYPEVKIDDPDSNNTPLRLVNGNKSPIKRKLGVVKMDEEPAIKTLNLELVKTEVASEVYEDNEHQRKLFGRFYSQKELNNCSTNFNNLVVYEQKCSNVKFKDVIANCSKRPNVEKIVLEDVNLSSILRKCSQPHSVCLPKLANYILKANVGGTKKVQNNFLKDLSSVNIEDVAFFYRNNEDLQFRVGDLWNDGMMNVRVSFNEVIGLSMKPGEMTLNYLKNSCLPFQNLKNLKSLNIGNYVLNGSSIVQDNYVQELTCLRLLYVNNLKISKYLRKCQSLEGFSSWPVDSQTPTFCLNDLNCKQLRHLSLQKHLIKINGTLDNVVFEKLKEVCLIDCSWDPGLQEAFPKMFPNLRKVFITSRFSSTSPGLLKTFLSLKNIESIRLWNFDGKALNREEFEEMREFLSHFNLQRLFSQELNFILTSKLNSEWQGINDTKSNFALKIFESFGFEKFYTYDAWRKYFWANHDYY